MDSILSCIGQRFEVLYGYILTIGRFAGTWKIKFLKIDFREKAKFHSTLKYEPGRLIVY
jgi:hypothetical protein